MYLKYALLLCVLLKINIVRSANTGGLGGGLSYPEAPEEEKFKQNVMNKQPVDLRNGDCHIGELFYPGDQSDDWVCDCKPGHIYYPSSDRCFPAFTRGPCDLGHHIVLPQGAILPVCVRNRCPSEEEVWFRGGCHRLNTAGPCRFLELNTVVSVNSTSLQLACIGNVNDMPVKELANRFDPDPLPWPLGECFIGGKRSIEGKCKDKA